MSETDDIPQDVWAAADAVWNECAMIADDAKCNEILARAILAERARWKPAAVYFERYCQDEADSVENCVCGQEQHDDAKSFRAATRGGSNG